MAKGFEHGKVSSIVRREAGYGKGSFNDEKIFFRQRCSFMRRNFNFGRATSMMKRKFYHDENFLL